MTENNLIYSFGVYVQLLLWKIGIVHISRQGVVFCWHIAAQNQEKLNNSRWDKPFWLKGIAAGLLIYIAPDNDRGHWGLAQEIFTLRGESIQ